LESREEYNRRLHEDTLSIQEYTCRAIFLADHSRLELIFSLD